MAEDARFCPNCGAPVGNARIQPDFRSAGYRQQIRQEPELGEKPGRRFRVSARPEVRILGIPVSGRTALIIIAAVIILVIIANKIGG